MLEVDDLNQPRHRSLTDQKLIYRSDFSEAKLKFAIMKASAQFQLRKNVGARLYGSLGKPFEIFTDCVFKLLR